MVRIYRYMAVARFFTPRRKLGLCIYVGCPVFYSEFFTPRRKLGLYIYVGCPVEGFIWVYRIRMTYGRFD